MDEEKKSVKTSDNRFINKINKKKGKRTFKIFIIILVIIFLVLLGITVGYFINKSSTNKEKLNQVVLENPMKKVIEENFNGIAYPTHEAVVQQGIINFDQNFIIYILLSLGVDKLHFFPGFGNPIVELVLDDEVWSSEISGGALITKKSPNDNKDLRFVLSKEEAVKALLSQDIKQFMKESVVSGRTRIEMIAGKPELLAKGYLDLYNGLK